MKSCQITIKWISLDLTDVMSECVAEREQTIIQGRIDEVLFRQEDELNQICQ